MNFDVFINYSSKDATAANAVCAALESAKIRCWIAPRDILPSAPWTGSIVKAINQCRVMVLTFSSNANGSEQVHREVDLAFSKGIPVLPLRIEDVVPVDELAYFLNSVHWLDALTPPLEKHLQQMVTTVNALLRAREQSSRPPEEYSGEADARQAEAGQRAEEERRKREAEAQEREAAAEAERLG